MKVVGLIPARLESTRLPRKAMLDICGLPMIVHTLKRAQMASSLDKVYVCTDSQLIAQTVLDNGGEVIMTSDQHINGTTRIAEAMRKFEAEYTLYNLCVDIQGDEPLTNPEHIDQVVAAHVANPQWHIVLPTLELPAHRAYNSNIVKVVKSHTNKVLYLSRSNVPCQFRGQVPIQKHLSIISFTPGALIKYSECEPSPLEKTEGVELLRALENDLTIGTLELDGDTFSVDTSEDYAAVIHRVRNDPLTARYTNPDAK